MKTVTNADVKKLQNMRKIWAAMSEANEELLHSMRETMRRNEARKAEVEAKKMRPLVASNGYMELKKDMYC